MGSRKNRMKETFIKLVSLVLPPGYWTGNLPIKYQDLRLVRQLHHSLSYFGTGLYKNGAGEKFIVKFWRGKRPDSNYYLFKRELTFIKKVSENRLSQVKYRFSEYVSDQESDRELSMVIKYSEGKTGGDPLEIIPFLQSMPTDLPVHNKDAFYFIFLYPLIWIIATIKNIDIFLLLLKSLLRFMRKIPSLFNSFKRSLVHGDLHPGNILVTKDGFTILDVGQSMYSYPELEAASLICSPATTSEMKKSLIELNKNKNVFSVLGIFCATYNLIRHATPRHKRALVETLQICLTV